MLRVVGHCSVLTVRRQKLVGVHKTTDNFRKACVTGVDLVVIDGGKLSQKGFLGLSLSSL